MVAVAGKSRRAVAAAVHAAIVILLTYIAINLLITHRAYAAVSWAGKGRWKPCLPSSTGSVLAAGARLA